jgi:hypothetical protein
MNEIAAVVQENAALAIGRLSNGNWQTLKWNLANPQLPIALQHIVVLAFFPSFQPGT